MHHPQPLHKIALKGKIQCPFHGLPQSLGTRTIIPLAFHSLSFFSSQPLSSHQVCAPVQRDLPPLFEEFTCPGVIVPDNSIQAFFSL